MLYKIRNVIEQREVPLLTDSLLVDFQVRRECWREVRISELFGNISRIPVTMEE